jgi:hypothetical protein
MIRVPPSFLNSYSNAFDTGEDLIENDRHLLNSEELKSKLRKVVVRPPELDPSVQTENVTRQAPDH